MPEPVSQALSATTLAQFVRLESCERYLWYRLHSRQTQELFREWRLTEPASDTAAPAEGAVHETAVTDELVQDGATIVDLSAQGVDASSRSCGRRAARLGSSFRRGSKETSVACLRRGLPI